MKKSFLKVYYELFSYKLSPAGFVVYLYLYNLSLVTNDVKVSYELLADKCNISPRTAHRAVHELIGVGLIEKKRRLNDIHYYSSNGYIVKHLQGRYTKVDKRIFNLKLDTSSLYILIAIYKCQNHRACSFPSYNSIAKITGLSRSTVINKVKLLNENGLIAKQKRVSTLFFDYISNAYATITLELRVFMFALALKLSRAVKEASEEISAILQKKFSEKKVNPLRAFISKIIATVKTLINRKTKLII